MGTFLFLLLLFFVIIPLVKVGWRIWQAQRAFSRMQEQARAAMNNAAGAGRRPGPQAPPRRRKKIDPTMGEYVAFEEVHATTTETTSGADGTTTFRTESQVEDAVWEEIK